MFNILCLGLLLPMGHYVLVKRFLARELNRTGSALVGHSLGTVLRLHVLGQLAPLLEHFATLLTLVLRVLQRRLVWMHPMYVSPECVSVG